MALSTTDFVRLEVAELREDVNKYHPGNHPFYIQALMPDQPIIDEPTPKPNKVSNLANDKTTKPLIITDEITMGSNIMIPLPREHTLGYSKKWIPKGTRFIVAFMGRDINNPKIIGRIDN